MRMHAPLHLALWLDAVIKYMDFKWFSLTVCLFFECNIALFMYLACGRPGITPSLQQ